MVGAQGAGASAAALLAAWAGATVDGCDPGGPSQYTPALEAAGLTVVATHDAAHVTREPHPDRQDHRDRTGRRKSASGENSHGKARAGKAGPRSS